MAWTTPRTWVAGELVTAALLNTHLRDNLVALRDGFWPVGSIFEAKVSTNPATLLGIGTWSAYGTGRVLVAIDGGQTEFDTVEETGGAKTHTLTTAEMPAHAHPGSSVSVSDTRLWRGNDSGASGGDDVSSQTALGASPNSYTNGPKVAPYSGTISATPTIASQGGGGAHNNLQPYIVVYRWVRTA